MADYERILVEPDGRIVTITINRPERMNAIDALTSFELKKVFTEFNDNDDRWVAILTGAGHRAFSAGHDPVQLSGLMASRLRTPCVNCHCVASNVRRPLNASLFSALGCAQ